MSEKKKKNEKNKAKIPIKYIYDANPLYVHFKKHYCPNCKSKLEIKYHSEIVNSNESKAVNYDFSIPDKRLKDDVEFRTSFFHCQNHNFDISFEDMKKLEKRH